MTAEGRAVVDCGWTGVGEGERVGMVVMGVTSEGGKVHGDDEGEEEEDERMEEDREDDEKSVDWKFAEDDEAEALGEQRERGSRWREMGNLSRRRTTRNF